MAELFLVPIISIFDVHDVAVREWLNKLDETSIRGHLEYPFKLERFFPESSQHALKSVDEVHSEVLRLLDIVNPKAVFLDISVDFVKLENRYNKRSISPLEFWSEYYQISASTGGPQAIYCIYIKGIIDKEIGLIENKDHLPHSVIFYGLDIKTRQELIPVYEKILEKDDEFLLQIARVMNEISEFRELPEHLWYSPMQVRQMGISYEETEKFYNELISRLNGMLKFRVRSYMIRNLKDKALDFISAYENFLEHKMKEDEIKISNILEGLTILSSQWEFSNIVIFCPPMAYCALMHALKKEKILPELGINMGEIDISRLLDKMKPFNQKNRIMQSNYDIALNILERKKPPSYDTPEAILTPVPGIPHLT